MAAERQRRQLLDQRHRVSAELNQQQQLLRQKTCQLEENIKESNKFGEEHESLLRVDEVLPENTLPVRLVL